MKRLRTSVARALENGHLKVGDEVWVKTKVLKIIGNNLELHIQDFGFWTRRDAHILITKPEPKPIDFGAEGRVLKLVDDELIVKTTGLVTNTEEGKRFSGVVLKCTTLKVGSCSNNWGCDSTWQDITDTYQP
jgi:hypothetical protein